MVYDDLTGLYSLATTEERCAKGDNGRLRRRIVCGGRRGECAQGEECARMWMLDDKEKNCHTAATSNTKKSCCRC